MEQIKKEYHKKNILITGGGGYLGSKLAKKLIDTKAKIILADIKFNDISNKLNKDKSNVNQITVDLTNNENIKSQFENIIPDYIFHFAASLKRERNFNEYDKLYEANVKMTLNLLNYFQNINYQNFIFSSSSEVYGSGNTAPFTENQVPNPASPYSLTKLMAENLISVFSNINHKPYTILRLFNFYGNDMPEHFFLSQLIGSLNRNEEFAMTKGEQIRDYTDIDILVENIMRISCKQKAINETINICSAKGMSIKDIALIIAKKQNKEHLLKIGTLPYRQNEVWNMLGSNELMNVILNKNE